MPEKSEALVGDCKERVAFDLMKLIAQENAKVGKVPGSDIEKYFLDLYRKCRQAVYGQTVTEATKEKRVVE